MRNINDILEGIDTIEFRKGKTTDVNAIQFDSRKVSSSDIFVAIEGTQVDGHKYINSCIEQGATTIICQILPQNINREVNYILVNDSAKALGILASNYYNKPSSKLKLVGITGTNGKTSTVTMLYNLFRKLGYKVGMLSTVSNWINDVEIIATHTTPDAIQLNSLLDDMVEDGCEYCFMEVSSHAIVQERISGLEFTGAIFSNITHDHLDFHKTFKEYIKAKKKFFDELSSTAFALVNTDDRNGMIMLQNSKAQKRTYAVKSMADYKAKIIENSFTGLHLEINHKEIWLPLIGEFNAYNIMSVYATAMELGADEMEVLQELSTIETAEGRFEFINGNDGVNAIVDYAHTPDALQNVINTINEIRGGNGKLITVVGTGGDRDKSKRPIMAQIAADNSDQLILTSDNPRTEDPEQILNDMQVGVGADRKRITLRISNRKEAIRTAFALATAGDIVLVAGKGHEKYQEIDGVRHHFDDKEIITEIIKN
ncbi:MAG: UDP-N-acetylmuramoyl-L-alanyl-D-glutamate--2,6-diaminopimelate ligase [Bacteroidetes bacterium 4572_112]|nr:MAG: UDP-N-acetylmuramoyl-L-alanyl-D-glutamate--2,6-diaminopimelate ligase [Bacteroidetes bacterium 4572_112]